MPTTKKPRRAWYLVALSLFLLGPLLGFYLLFGLFHIHKHIVKLPVPGESNIVIQKSGDYTMWGAVPQPSGSQPALLPEVFKKLDFLFKNTTTGEVIDFQPEVGWHENKNGMVDFSLGNIYFPQPGQYTVVAQGPSLQNFQLYLRKPSLSEILKTILFSIFLIVLGLISGILFGLIIFIKRLNADTMKEEIPPPPKTVYDKPATTWAMFCHLSGFAGFLFPFANVIAPLIIWSFKKDESPFIDDQGKEAINFQISILIYYVISLILIFVVVGLFLIPLIAAFHIIAMIVACVESASGKVFRYPLCIRFLKPTLTP